MNGNYKNSGHHFILGEYMKLVTSVHFTHMLYQAQPAENKVAVPQVNPLWLIAIFALCAITSFLLCYAAKVLFPKFRSGEHKPGTHRPDLPAGGREIKTIELPLVGGPAFMLAVVGIGLTAGFLLNFNYNQWAFLLIGLFAAVGYAAVGFIDDWNKVHSNEGLTEFKKFTGVFLVGCIAAILYFFLLPDLGQQSYAFYKDLPILNTLLCGKPNPSVEVCDVSNATLHPIAHYSWLIFLMLLIGAVGSFTSLSVDFSDGLDGLAGGLVFSASLAMAIIVAGLMGKWETKEVLEILSLLAAGAMLGYLPLNWPSAWAARRGKAKRRARIYMGDCGALGIGGLLAITAIFSRNELLLIMIGGAFVLEGLSVLVSARIMTRFFRRHLQILRFEGTNKFVPHTEFPLPFLATPLHHHFDLLGWDRRRLVYGAWALGAGFAALGVMAGLAPLTWQRYVARFLIFILGAAVWSSGSWSKCYFVGKCKVKGTRRRRLALYYGYPFSIMGIRLYHRVEVIEASEDVIETPAEELALWQRMTIYDARSMLGLYCYRAGYYPAAMAQWSRIFERNRVLRPEIAHLLTEVESRLAMEQQETQPIYRDQIALEGPILTGNLPPADLPNPHEPVSQDQNEQDFLEDWQSSRGTPNEDETQGSDEEEEQVTAPLRGEIPGSHPS
jgi:UDP-N-acetylmuramyl pentapeptide phosphotransferase/UDP-N-acetylglucosamine-1-phosphate transferase